MSTTNVLRGCFRLIGTAGEFSSIPKVIRLRLWVYPAHLTGIYPSSFTIVRFLTNIEFSNFVEFRFGSQGAVSSAMGSCWSPGGGLGGKPLKHFDLFCIWRTNK